MNFRYSNFWRTSLQIYSTVSEYFKEIIHEFPFKNEYFIGGNLASFKCSKGVFPEDGSIMQWRLILQFIYFF